MNPHAVHPKSIGAIFRSVWSNRQLIAQLARRDVVGRYRGASVGLAWAVLTPLLMLTVYTFVFSVVFKSRWGTIGSDSRADFAIALFVGMVVHGLFAEVINRAPTMVLANANFVKKVVFPLEILPVVSIASSLFHACASLFVLLIAMLILSGAIPWTAVLLPLVVLPLVVLTLGVAWFVASIGVFVRDVSQITTFLTTVMMFLSPVFYPLSALPPEYRPIIMANPLTFIIEQARAVLVFGELPSLGGLVGYLAAAIAVAWAGYAWFQSTRKGFADVL